MTASHPPTITHALLCIAVLLLTLSCSPHAVSAAGFSANDYGRWFHGDGTYYGWDPTGNCGYRNRPAHYLKLPAVAMNEAQYANSASCGSCVKVVATGRGAGRDPIVGTFIALVHDRCPECLVGDLDMSKPGDGRWDIKFTYVPCPFKDDVSFMFEGSHKWYWKVQARGLKYPVKSMMANGVKGTSTKDNFFVMQNDAGHKLPTTMYVTDIMGRKFTARIDYVDNEVDIRPKVWSGPQGVVGGSSPSSTPKHQQQTQSQPNKRPSASPTRRPQCVPRHQACGWNSWYKTNRCCHNKYHCSYVASAGGHRCVLKHQPQAGQCLEKFKRCRRSKYSCCGSMVCRKRSDWRYFRCLPRL